jgi:DNA mismatch repair protein MutL
MGSFFQCQQEKMKDIIQLLPDSLANQIAAGEVVQRPASAVKELMENAIDAGASHVQLLVKEAGKQLIQVIDDGSGMSETDARMSFERHATSKIKNTDDLFNIRTMGFRGEALASIAAVAQVEMRTRRASDELGTCIRMEGALVKAQELVTCPVGTCISVKNLFFNVPARRNFLKSNAVEMRHILDEFHHIALSYPDKAFSLTHNDTEVYKLTAGKLSHRIVSLFGKTYREQLTHCQEDTSFISVQGYVGKPEFAKKTRGEQFFFVNNRYIRHNYLHHAVMTAYDNLVPEGSYPFYVLFIEIDPIHIDINVHPTKTEIKFDDERAVYAIVAAAVRKALGAHNLLPSLDFETNVQLSEMLIPTGPKPQPTSFTGEQPPKTPREKSNSIHWQKLYEDFQEAFLKENAAIVKPEKLPAEELTFSSKVNHLDGPIPEKPMTEPDGPVFQLHNRYLIMPSPTGMLLVDRQLAHERILYERFLERISQHARHSQQLLFPLPLSFSRPDFELLGDIQEEIQLLGFTWEVIGPDSISLQGIPAEVASGEEKASLEGLIEQYKWQSAHLKLSKQESVARALAKRAAVRPKVPMGGAEAQWLFKQLLLTSHPNHTPDGKPILVSLTLEKLASFFGK